MKKLFCFIIIFIIVLSTQAQRCAVLEFKAGVGISQNDVDGISAIFITYFRPAGYTLVERTQIDKVIEEQGFQRSKMTQAQMVRVGEILNVSKIVVGDINVVAGQYNVDARVINVESGTISATEGATFASSSYRTNMQSIATKLAAKIAITPGPSVKATPSTNTTSNRRSGIEVLYGYLKIFPSELGTFQAEPTSVITQINKQAKFGYNNWRIPTNEELSLMKANNYLSSGEYMTSENRRGIVLLVSDGEDFETIKIKEKERIEEQERKAAEDRRMEEERKAAELQAAEERKAAELARKRAEQELQAAEERKAAELKAQGFVDLGLPSGTWWKDRNESGGYNNFFTYEQAVNSFGNNLPSEGQFKELVNKCSWVWTGKGYKVSGPNGNSIYIPANGVRQFDKVGDNGSNNGWYRGWYWSSTPYGSSSARVLLLDKNEVLVNWGRSGFGLSVRLVQKL